MPLKLFVVFRERIDDVCYAQLSEEERSCLTFFAIDRDVPKEYDAAKYTVVNEWELPEYDPFLCEVGFGETSAMWHVFTNKLYDSAVDHVGFVRSDVVFARGSVDGIIGALLGPPQCLVDYSGHSITACFKDDSNTLDIIANGFQDFYRLPFNLQHLRFPLLNTWVLRASDFDSLVPWTMSVADAVLASCQSGERGNDGLDGDGDVDVRDGDGDARDRVGIVFEHMMGIGLGNLYTKPWRRMYGLWTPVSRDV